MIRQISSLVAACLVLALPQVAQSISRDEVITRAQTYAYHPWYCSADNLTNDACPGSYRSDHPVGTKMGLPYDWGGFMTIDVFDRGIMNGAGAGSLPSDGEHSCTVGLDCSGFVSMCWKSSSHLSTLWMHDNLPEISREAVMAGDVYNYRAQTWGHVVMWSHEQANGQPFLYESVGWGVHPTYNLGWIYLDGYIPREHSSVTGPEPGELVGTAANPIEIVLTPDAMNPGWFIYSHSDDTRDSTSDMFDQCAADWDNWEAGAEVIYRLELDAPGRLVVSVEDDAADIDVHLLEALNELDCIARAHETLDWSVDCGEYYIIADSWSGSSGATPQDGTYTLTVSYEPTERACGDEHGYDVGRPGSPCGYPGDESLPTCGPAFGAVTCLYTSDDSFCSMECQVHSDCAGDMPGGCCRAVNSGETFCHIAEYCADLPGDAGVETPADAGSTDADRDAGTGDTEVPPLPDTWGADADVNSEPSTQPDDAGFADQSRDDGAGASSDDTNSVMQVSTNSGCSVTTAPLSVAFDWRSLTFVALLAAVIVRARRR